MDSQGENISKMIIEQSPFIIIILGICAFICYEIYLASTDDSLFQKNSMFYVAIILIPLVTIFTYILYGYTLDKQEIVLLYVTLGLALSILLVLYIFIYTGLSKLIFNEYLLYTVSIAITLVGLAIVYNVFSERLRKQMGWSGFFINILFYIPCLISDFIKFFIKESNETPRTTFILFIVEILLILWVLYIYPFMQSVINMNSVLLLDKPVMLSGVTRIDAALQSSGMNRISSPIIASQLTNGSVDSIPDINQKFAVSMWIYINPMSSSKMGYTAGKETNIFNYGYLNSSSNSHHPQIVHIVGDGPNNIRFYLTSDLTSDLTSNLTSDLTSGEKGKYDMMIPYQKWNNIIFNYNGNGVDLFINGILEYSYLFSNDQPSFQQTDIMVVGQDNGLVNNDSIYGSICNVVYYKDPMTNIDIINNYNLLMYKNPPVR